MNDQTISGGRLPRRFFGGRMGKLALAVLILALAAAGLYAALGGWREPAVFQYGNQTLTALEGMAVNPYDREDFTVDQRGRVVYERDGRRAKTGIDVSVYQQEIDWQAVAADGVEFAILRLGYRGYTEGGLIMDGSFAANLQGAKDAGLEVGVYFFSQAVTPEEAEAEADFVIDALGGCELSYPVAFDWEPITGSQEARTNGLTGETLTQCAAAFCARIREAGYEPAVYFNQDLGYLRYDLREVEDSVLWLAEYDAVPDFYYYFDLWQYTHTGTVAGIEGNVDLNLDLRLD